MHVYPAVRAWRATACRAMGTAGVLSALLWAACLALLALSGKATAADAASLTAGRCGQVVGSWRWFNGAQVECRADGRCDASNGFSGAWACVDPAGRVEIRWSRDGRNVQYVDTLQIASDGSLLIGNNQLGGRVSAIRAEASTAPPLQPGPTAARAAPAKEVREEVGVPLSEAQQETVQMLGWPDAFSILRVEEDGRTGRLDAWTWHDSELTYVFLDGHFHSVQPATWLTPGASPTPLRPDRFTLGMTPAQAEAVAGDNWGRMPLFDVIDGVTVYATDWAVLMFEQDRLRGLETWSATARSIEGRRP